MFGQLIYRLAATSSSPEVEEESPVGQEGSPEQAEALAEEDCVRQWRVVSKDGVSSLLDLDSRQCDPVESDSVENTDVEELHPQESIAESFSLDASGIGPRRSPASSPNIGMPSALPRTTEILQAAASSQSPEARQPNATIAQPKTPLRTCDETALDLPIVNAEEPARANSSSPAVGDVDAISRSLVADAVAASPARFRRFSQLAVLKTPAGGREIDANLAKIITQWPTLSWPVQAAVLAMIDAASHESKESR